MNPELKDFVERAKQKGLSDEDIKHRLLSEGWSHSDVNFALSDGDDLVVPKPPTNHGHGAFAPMHGGSSNQPPMPVPVVQNLSVRGFEYSIMFLSLWATTASVVILALQFLDNMFEKASSTYDYGNVDTLNTFMITILLVFFPIFAALFLRLKKAELADSSMRRDPSRRRFTQLTQLAAFLFGMAFIINFIYRLITPDRYDTGRGVGYTFLQTFIVLVIVGGVFAYYWFDDHKKEQ